MIVKTSFKGPGMVKYGVFSIIIKLAIIALWIIFAVIPYGGQFLTMLNESLNTQAWDVIELLKPIGMIFLWFVGAIVVEAVLIFGIIFPAASAELKSRHF